MTAPKRFLFAITGGGGTVPADTSVIRALVRRGHDVRVLADHVLAPDVATTGARHVPWTTAPQRPGLGPQDAVIRDWEARTPGRIHRSMASRRSAHHATDVDPLVRARDTTGTQAPRTSPASSRL